MEMRKLKLQAQVSIDGFIAGPNSEMDWMEWNWSADIKDYIQQLTSTVDTILLGRKLAEGFIPYWTAAYNKSVPEEGAKEMVETPKVVFTKTLQQSLWENTVLAQGELSEEVQMLKSKKGADMIVYGGSGFVSSLIEADLIDEYNLLVNPAAIGKGMPIFQRLSGIRQLKLKLARGFDCGIALLCYEKR
jgi:dihydrofolate reductase